MNEPSVQTDRLSKRYGTFMALAPCSLQVGGGEVFGLLGPNGAGKTTLLRTLLGFLSPTSGSASICGFDIATDSIQVRRHVAYLPAEARLPRHMRGASVLRFFAELHPHGSHQRSLQLAQELDLDVRRRVALMSTGMRQKLALCIVLSTLAPVMILDEPTANLDPSVRQSVLNHVQRARSQGRTVIFSSHVLSEIGQVCDRVAFLRRGELVWQQSIAHLQQSNRITMAFDGATPTVPEALQRHVKILESGQHTLVLHCTENLMGLVKWLAELPLSQLRIEPLGLDALYHRIHHGDGSLPDQESRQ